MANNTREETVELCRGLRSFNLMQKIGLTEEKCLQWLQSVGIIPYLNENQFICPTTNNPNPEMRMRVNRGYTGNYSYHCITCRRADRPYPQVALTSNTWISGKRLSPGKVIQMT